jgi:hypothetical protein
MKRQALALLVASGLQGCGGGGPDAGWSPLNTVPGANSAPSPAPSTPGTVAGQSNQLFVVTYRVRGSATKAGVTIETEQGGTSQLDVTLPWTRSAMYGKDAFLYVSAQSGDEGQTIVAEIIVNGIVTKTTASVGDYVIASSSMTCC